MLVIISRFVCVVGIGRAEGSDPLLAGSGAELMLAVERAVHMQSYTDGEVAG